MTERESGSSLFERICEAANPPSHQCQKAALLHSIRNNLCNILNTRSGSCYGSPELGLIDFNDESPDCLNIRDGMLQAIRDCILHYEPRITDVAVMSVAEDHYAPLELRFHIVASLDFNNQQDVLEFDILLDKHQHWNVE
ncbi:type VI secretion system baseplate subunit TssE [Yokenella regensburgei]|uniref:type VI secretion system baseplate subunit TssE n=1 Tax=Yokenella regensburgei TaxID=158877 RepID=UPI003F1766FF